MGHNSPSSPPSYALTPPTWCFLPQVLKLTASAPQLPTDQPCSEQVEMQDGANDIHDPPICSQERENDFTTAATHHRIYPTLPAHDSEEKEKEGEERKIKSEQKRVTFSASPFSKASRLVDSDSSSLSGNTGPFVTAVQTPDSPFFPSFSSLLPSPLFSPFFPSLSSLLPSPSLLLSSPYLSFSLLSSPFLSFPLLPLQTMSNNKCTKMRTLQGDYSMSMTTNLQGRNGMPKWRDNSNSSCCSKHPKCPAAMTPGSTPLISITMLSWPGSFKMKKTTESPIRGGEHQCHPRPRMMLN